MSNFTERNREYFESEAPLYNTKHQTSLSHLTTALLDNIPLIAGSLPLPIFSEDDDSSPSLSSPPLKLLDYACGTGNVTEALSRFFTRTIGIDLASGMVNLYNTKASNQGLSASEMHAYVGNLIARDDPRPAPFESEEFWGFDMAVVGLGFHHFEDVGLAAGRLAERLREGGVLVVVDFLPHEGFGLGHHHGHGHGHGHDHEHAAADAGAEKKATKEEEAKVAETVVHLGFSREEVQKLFEGAGVGEEFGYTVLGKGVVVGSGTKMKREVFIARGTKG